MSLQSRLRLSSGFVPEINVAEASIREDDGFSHEITGDDFSMFSDTYRRFICALKLP